MEFHIVAHRYAFLWAYLLGYINIFINSAYPSWTRVGLAVSMAATWLFAVVLVRIPSTRRMFLEDLSGLSILCEVFWVLWTFFLLQWYDGAAVELEMVTWTGVLKRLPIFLGSILAWALEFVVMLCFWGDLQWKDPIATFWWFITWGPTFRDVEEGDPENDLHLFAYSSLLHEDPAQTRRLLLPGNTVEFDIFQ
ncbi:uncharacterized protein HD556DRAFT_1528610 [Suillus plorans]|uniref:Uncharacterized protein n=1 Tax=Suillus plorans TaxID=116603 RepID=A0A9P7DF82_9AGAM|nr:uncharacterized protein HD556DRAFT_1528610 [Suillus plorans]KAG1791050.1 hypothetical protein HD556DRAFT_1528610 [Suillus plorans]